MRIITICAPTHLNKQVLRLKSILECDKRNIVLCPEAFSHYEGASLDQKTITKLEYVDNSKIHASDIVFVLYEKNPDGTMKISEEAIRGEQYAHSFNKKVIRIDANGCDIYTSIYLTWLL